MNYFKFKTENCFYCAGRPTGRPRPVCRPGRWQRPPASEPAQTGAQAGGGPEGAGLVAGPGRAPGRSCSRANRPPGRSGRCPGRKHGDRDAAVAAGGTTARSVAARERGKSGKRERRSRPHQELVGVARCGQGGPRRPEIVEDGSDERRRDRARASTIRSIPSLPANVLRWRR